LERIFGTAANRNVEVVEVVMVVFPVVRLVARWGAEALEAEDLQEEEEAVHLSTPVKAAPVAEVQPTGHYQKTAGVEP
jgi:hypothetical protein